MAKSRHVSDSENSWSEDFHTPEPEDGDKDLSQPQSVLSHRFRDSPQNSERHKLKLQREEGKISISNGAISVILPAPARPWEYQPYRGDDTVETVMEEVEGVDGETVYKIEFEDGHEEDVSVHLFRFLPAEVLPELPTFA